MTGAAFNTPVPRRIAIEALLCLAAGALIAQGWAYACYYKAVPYYLGDQDLPKSEMRLPSFLRGWWTEPDVGTFQAGLSKTGGVWGAGRTSTMLRCPLPPTNPPAEHGAEASKYGLYTESYGWPMRSLVRCHECVLISNGNSEHIDIPAFFQRFERAAGLRRGVKRIGWGAASWDVPKNTAIGDALPVWPVWGGWAVNAALYGLAAWLMVFAPWRLRRAARRRRGRCERCAYDLRGLAPGAICPECGAAR